MRLTINLLSGLLSVFLGICPLAYGTTVNNSDQGLHVDWLDKSVSPSQNFFKFANGTWQQQNPIPPDYSNWGTLNILQKQNQEIIHQILEKAAKNTQAKPGSELQKIGDFYYSGMDEALINKLGAKPLQPEFDRINNIKTVADLQKAITHLHRLGVDAVFNFGQMQDFKDSTQVIGVAAQGGLGLPDRDYYLKDDPRSKQIREAYLQHIAKTFELLGDSPATASAAAKTVLNLETVLAQASMSRIALRDPHAVYHPMTLAQLAEQTPNFNWQQYFTDIGRPDLKSINFATPDFFKSVNTQLTQVPLADWKTYLRWHLIDNFADALSQPFVDENFRFSSLLSGTQKLRPRWQRVVNAANGALGFAIGKLYVAQAFPPASKAAVLEILHNIRAALKDDLKTLAWMSPETRLAAIKKLDLMVDRIGYPEKWRDYSGLQIDRGPYVLNVLRASEFLNQRELNKIGKPVDKNEWDMTPQTVNAYYDPSMNNLNIPAGILQPPLFDPKAPAAANYAALGFIMGHEMTHGFDDQGAQFDGYGNLKNWWTPDDKKRFAQATGCIADQFSKFTVEGDAHVQGKLVVGEATADLGGLMLAYRAFHASDAYKNAPTIAGFTPDQQFFLGAAHVWASNIRPDEARRLVVTDPHPPAIYRINGTLANMPQFQTAFAVPDGSPMVNNPRCVIW